MASKTISVKLKVWRQASQASSGRLVDYAANNISTDMSFLEMLDVVNEDLIGKGEDAIAFDSDCREGICGACVAACKNAAAHLFTSAKITHLALLPQGHPERERRVLRMVDQMAAEGFGACSNEGECEAVCPKLIPISNIAKMVREYVRAIWYGASTSL